jgi:unsaturated rhamnogalacturonyl hydrolase
LSINGNGQVWRRIWIALVAACFAGAQLQAQQMPFEQELAAAGDSPITALPLAKNLSVNLTRRDVARAIRKVGDWQLERAQPVFNQTWEFGALYAGFMAVPRSVAADRYQDAMVGMGKKFSWQLGPRLEHADDHAVGQTYLETYLRYKDKAMLSPTKSRIDEMMRLPDPQDKAQNQPLWWWCDALFMAPPVLARLSTATGERKYLDFMDRQWWITSGLLYDPVERLYSRDATFLDKHESNGKKLFWSRGNGWVMAGLVRVLEKMPKDYPSRGKYEAQLKEMAAAVLTVQGADGLWRPGLLDAKAYPLPETSGSAFITYALAYGVNNGLLDKRIYRPAIEKAWGGLLSHVYADGRLGCIQPVGAAPGVYIETSSFVYGVGAYLLAGSEIYKMANR